MRNRLLSIAVVVYVLNYVLPEIATFDKYGLWRYQKCFFPEHGNLKKTSIHLITTSEAGLNGK